MDGNEKETKQDNQQEIKRNSGKDGKKLPEKQGEKSVSKKTGPTGRKKAKGKSAGTKNAAGSEKKKVPAEKQKAGTGEAPEEKETSEPKKAFKPKVLSGGKETSGQKKTSATGGKETSGQKKTSATGGKKASGQKKKSGRKEVSSDSEKSTGMKKDSDGKKAPDSREKNPEKTTESKKDGQEKKSAGAEKKTEKEKKAKGKKAKGKKEKEKKEKGETNAAKKKPAARKISSNSSGKPNLRLVKNGDLPVKEEKPPAKKKNEKKAEKKTAQRPKTEKKKEKDSYQDKLEFGEWFIQHKSLVIIGLMVFAFFSLLFGIYRYITTAYEVTTVYVDGNLHYTNEEVMDMVMGGKYGNNSLYLAMKYRDKGIEGMPFVEKMDVDILTPNTIRISVYEKALAGYVEYLGRYMYFDRDGTVVESSESRTSGIPQVTGLRFDYVVLNEPLPVENDEIFKRILDITQLLNKYELMADKIFFDSSYDLTLFFDGIKVTLGSNSNIDQKIIRLKNILPELEGKTGTIQMENYTEDTKNITFHQE